jgi:hypothetical protein
LNSFRLRLAKAARRLWRPNLAAAAVIVFGGIASVAVNSPGHLSYDSVLQLLEGREGVYNNWHPPVMSWLLGVCDSTIPGAALFIVFNAVLAYGALASIMAATGGTSWIAPMAAAVCIALPQLFIMQGIVWKDVLFANASLAGFTLLFHAALQWERWRARAILLLASAACLALAALTRQNGVLILLPAGAALGAIAYARAQNARLTKAALGALTLTAGCVVAAAGGKAWLELRAIKQPGAYEMLRQLQIYDIIGAAKADPAFEPAILEREAPQVAALIDGGKSRYTPLSSDPVSDWQELAAAVAASPDAVSRQWRDLIIHHPLTYLSMRGEVFRWLFAPPDPSKVYFYGLGVDGPQPELGNLGMALRFDARDNALYRYSRWFTDAGLMHPVFAVINAVCFIVLWLRRRPEDYAFLALISSAALFAASFFVLSIASDYRYLYFTDLAAIGSGLYVLAGAPWRRLAQEPQRRPAMEMAPQA